MSKPLSMPFLGVAQGAHEFVKQMYIQHGLERALEISEACFPTMPSWEREGMCLGALRPVFSLDGNRIEGWTYLPGGEAWLNERRAA